MLKDNINKNNSLVIIHDRNYGIDLLRIIAMLYVVILHCIDRGGILNSLEKYSGKYNCILFIKIFTFCAVNIFALISGYVIYTDEERKIKISNYFKIWLQVVYYGILVTFIFHVFRVTQISVMDYIYVLFPVTNDIYWYFTAYSGMYLFIPFINKLVRNCNERQAKKLFVIIILIFSIYSMIFNGFFLNFGYSLLWIMLVYILGAIVKKCRIGEKLKTRKAIILIIAGCVITYLYCIYGFEADIMNIKITRNMFFSYTSPTILGISILYLIIFKKINFKSITKKIVKFAAPSSFAIYIINNHLLVWNHIMNDLFVKISNKDSIKIITTILIFSIVFVMVVLLIDQIRIFIFKVLYLDKKLQKFSNFLEGKVNKLANMI